MTHHITHTFLIRLPSLSHQGMAKRKSTKRAKKFVIPSLLKTEQIEVEDIKPEIDPPCTDSKTSGITGIADNTIYYTCGGCGESSFHHLGLEYRIVRTATLVEVGSQTGDDSEIQDKMIGSGVGVLDDAVERNKQNEPVSVPISSTASPIVVSSDNGKFWGGRLF